MVFIVGLIVSFFFFLSPLYAGEVELAVGIDSNPAGDATRDETSFFSETRFFTSKEIASGLSFGLDGFFRDYEKVPDRFLGTFSVDYYRPFGRFALEGEAGVSLYRNGFTTEDEFNGYHLALRVNTSFGLTQLDLEAFYERRLFLHFESVGRFWRRYGQGFHPSYQDGRKRGPRHEKTSHLLQKISRKDDFWELKLGLSRDIYPFLLEGTIFYRKNDSNFPLEAYEGPGLEFRLGAMLASNLRLTLGARLEKSSFERAPRKEDRRDYLRVYEVSLESFFSRWRVTLEFVHENQSSSFTYEDYERNYFRCGWGFSF